MTIAHSKQIDVPSSPPPTVAPNSQVPGTILSIQILRFVAAFIVVLFHAHLALTLELEGHVPGAIDHAFRVGASGVHVFFVISGFVMVYTTMRSKLTSAAFLSRRLIRIYPIYWVLAAAYLLAHLWLREGYNLTAGQALLALLLWPPDSSLIIGPGWTLSYEMYFYLSFALALLLGIKRGLVLLSAYFIFSIALGLLIRPDLEFGKLATNSLLLEFIAGGWLGYAFASGMTIGRVVSGILVALGILIFASGFWLPYERLPSAIAWGIPALFLVSGALGFEPALRGPPAHFFAKLGDSSYLLYLSHVLLIDVAIATPLSLANRSEMTAVALSLPISVFAVVVAAFGYRVVELPLLNLLKRLLLKRRPSGAAGQTVRS